ncbi:DDE-type integrase/transposase/recombinase [Polaromonas sp. JS666]|uniref:DDE-type integrase/transposase/recombinase n=1 Tax=Polaromonas sp. (strain JS666 / ATCC BAA-500) TaxID=296591 RepID=UPI0000535432|nr:DDE-type integrase/transposase/recombinase [Polaromonas sp. JS666]ABE46317.1 hypothetical protein Bpro_4430 [Polaromonas sp. JS666]
MFNDQALRQYFEARALGTTARNVILKIRESDPVRNVSNRAGNMAGTHASSKMQRTIQWESWSGERALAVLWEFDPDALEFWDQTYDLKITYTLPTGRRTGLRTVPDYLLLAKNFCGFVDFKTSAELRELAVDQPTRYVQIADGKWDQPPAREASQSLGLDYQLLSDLDIPHVLVRNLEFLRPRMLHGLSTPETSIDALKQSLIEQKKIVLSEAINMVGDPNIIYWGHFWSHWFLSLNTEPLAHPDSSCVYLDKLARDTFGAVERCYQPLLSTTLDADSIPDRAFIRWDNSLFQLLNRSTTHVYLQPGNGPLVTILRRDFAGLVSSNAITANVPARLLIASGLDILKSSTSSSQMRALEKLKILERHWSGEQVIGDVVAERTLRDWVACFRGAEEEYGNGFLGLINKNHLKGNRTARTSKEELALVEEAFEWLKVEVARPPAAGYAVYVASCHEAAIIPRSENSFMKLWGKNDKYEETLTREGKRAAYPHKAPHHKNPQSILQGPPEGDSPFNQVHVDHTQLDFFCRRENSSALLGKPWLSLAIDACTRLVLGWWLSMLAPSTASVLMVLRDMVRRHGKLPLYTITDSGKDFSATRVKQFLASHRCGHGFRPAGEPRFGNPVERLNLDISMHFSQVVYGSNKIFKTPRMSSATHDPRNLAYLTMGSSASKLEELFFDLYPQRPHSGLGESPDSKLRSAAIMQGTSWGVPTRFDDRLLFQTLATPHKHGGLVRQRDGIRLNGHNYFSPLLVGGGNGRHMRELPLYDPEDPTYIQARVDSQWTRCDLLDSQRKRLPSSDLKYYLSEKIFLNRHSTNKDDIRAYQASLGSFYKRTDEDRDRDAIDSLDASPADPPVQPDTPALPFPPIQAAPVSKRPRHE